MPQIECPIQPVKSGKMVLYLYSYHFLTKSQGPGSAKRKVKAKIRFSKNQIYDKNSHHKSINKGARKSNYLGERPN